MTDFWKANMLIIFSVWIGAWKLPPFSDYESLIILVRPLLFQGILNNRLKDIAKHSIRNEGGDFSQWKAQMVQLLEDYHPNYKTIFY